MKIQTKITDIDLSIDQISTAKLISLMQSDEYVISMWNNNYIFSTPSLFNTDELSRWMFAQNSWQLTLSGWTFMSKIFTSYYSHKNVNNYRVNGRVLINMSRLVKGPWYILNGKVYVWNHLAHFELSMFDGNVHEYINFHVPK